MHFHSKGTTVLRAVGVVNITIPAALFFVFAEALKIPSRRNAGLLSPPKRDSRYSGKPEFENHDFISGYCPS